MKMRTSDGSQNSSSLETMTLEAGGEGRDDQGKCTGSEETGKHSAPNSRNPPTVTCSGPGPLWKSSGEWTEMDGRP